MPCSLIDFDDLRLVAPEVIELEPDYFIQAAQISDRVFGEACQWQTYLNALGLQGFTRWVAEQDSSIVIDQADCSLFQPPYANAIDAVCNLRIGSFKLCLIAAENVLSETITISKAALDLPDFSAHFYVITEVQEEQEQVIIRGYGRYDQLVHYRHSSSADSWHYVFPLSLFDAEPNHLLLNLRFLEAAAIALSGEIANPATPITQSEFNTVLSQLHSPGQCLWQFLSWEKGASLLQNPEFLNLFYQWQQSSEKPISLCVRITEIFTLLTQQALNTAQWVHGELDILSQSFDWYPPRMLAAGASEFRSTDRFSAAIDELRYQGMDIPVQLNPMFKTFECAGNSLQMYAATWASAGSIPEWTLLLILRNQIERYLPDGLELQVADLTGTLDATAAALDTELLYIRADARQDAKLIATIVSSEGQVLPLEPYSFDADSVA